LSEKQVLIKEFRAVKVLNISQCWS